VIHSGHVPPNLPAHDQADEVLGHAVLSGEFVLGQDAKCVGGSDVSDLEDREFRPSVLLSTRAGLRVESRRMAFSSWAASRMLSAWVCISLQGSSFAHLVVCIVLGRSKEKVGQGVTARAVAAVQDHEPVRDRPVGKFPGQSVDSPLRALASDETVSGSVRSPLPIQTPREVVRLPAGSKSLFRHGRSHGPILLGGLT
jgi:hypothetical protein